MKIKLKFLKEGCKVKKKENEWVLESDSGEILGAHSTKEKAEEQQKAIYYSKNKESKYKIKIKNLKS